ncbi:MAG: helix-turn-helix transcriptional regulator, partial [Firmicutes bacterium]|nr:helix-turn-helix transcriptional regulator [Bacillota bacterium]
LSFSDLLSLACCEYAQRLLGSTHDTVDQIASLSGFANRKHLGTQFQKWFHMTPSEYRKSLANQYGNPNEIIRRPFDWEEAERILNEEYLM